MKNHTYEIKMNDLKEFDDDFKNAELANLEDLPNGNYQARVERAQLKYSAAGHKIFAICFKIIGPEHAGFNHWYIRRLSSASIPWLKKDLTVMGLNLTKFSELPDYLEELLDKILEISVTQSKDGLYKNTYINALINDSSAQEKQEDDIPF